MDRSVRRSDPARRPMDQGHGGETQQSADRASRRGVRDRAGRARRHARVGHPVDRIRGGQVRRHLCRKQRPSTEEGNQAALRHALQRFGLGAVQSHHHRVPVLSQRFRSEVSGQILCRAEHSQRRAGSAAEHRGPHRRLFPLDEERPHRFVPAAHAHARQRYDAGGDQPGQHHHHPQLGGSLRLQLAYQLCL